MFQKNITERNRAGERARARAGAPRAAQDYNTQAFAHLQNNNVEQQHTPAARAPITVAHCLCHVFLVMSLPTTQPTLLVSCKRSRKREFVLHLKGHPMVEHRAGAVSGVELNVVSESNEHCHVVLRAPPPPAASVEAAAAPSILEMFRDILSPAWFMHSIERVFPCDSACDGLSRSRWSTRALRGSRPCDCMCVSGGAAVARVRVCVCMRTQVSVFM